MRSRRPFLWLSTRLRCLLTGGRKRTPENTATAVNIGIGYWDSL